MASAQESTVLIIGAGIFGSSTAYHLACKYKDPSKITVLDRAPFPSPEAASTDINKIIRKDYASPFYCELAHEAVQAWETWPELKPYYHPTGRIMLDRDGSDLAQRVRKTLNERGWDHTEDVPLSQLDKRWRGVLRGSDTDGITSAYWNPDAGWCDATAATAAVMQAAVDRGVQYTVGEVDRLGIETQDQVIVYLRNGGVVCAEQIVLATGGWTSKLMSSLEDDLDLPDEYRVERQAVAAGVCAAHYNMSADEMTALEEMPVVVYREYGEIIPPSADNNLLKYTNAHTFTNLVTTASGHQISVPPQRDQHIVPEALKDETGANMMSKIMPLFVKGKPVDYWRLCWDATTPTQDWLLDRHPHGRLENLFFAIGGSFHSYKFLPNAGRYMVNVLSGKGNGTEKDNHWSWKTGSVNWQGAQSKTIPDRDLSSLE